MTPLTRKAISELRYHSRLDFSLHREECLCYAGKIINGPENESVLSSFLTNQLYLKQQVLPPDPAEFP